MGKLTLPARAQRFANGLRRSSHLTQDEAARYGFQQGFQAHQRDVRPKMIKDRHELMRRFYFLAQRGLWREYLAATEAGELEFVKGIKTPRGKPSVGPDDPAD